MGELELLKEKTRTLDIRFNPNHGKDGKFAPKGGAGGGFSGGINKYSESVKNETEKVKGRLSNDVRPFQKEAAPNMQKIKERGGVNDADAKVCADIAEGVYKEAAAKEPAITKDIVSSVEGVNGKMYGLDYRLKQTTSMAGKIGADANSDNITFQQAGANIKDAIRYTAVMDEKNFTNDYRQIKSNLESKGYKETRCKNFYDMYENGKSSQKAVQCVYEDPSGYKFELQFHTPTSQGAKELNHPLYEKQREATTSEKEKKALGAQMTAIGKNVPNPPDVLTIKSHG